MNLSELLTRHRALYQGEEEAEIREISLPVEYPKNISTFPHGDVENYPKPAFKAGFEVEENRWREKLSSPVGEIAYPSLSPEAKREESQRLARYEQVIRWDSRLSSQSMEEV